MCDYRITGELPLIDKPFYSEALREGSFRLSSFSRVTSRNNFAHTFPAFGLEVAPGIGFTVCEDCENLRIPLAEQLSNFRAASSSRAIARNPDDDEIFIGTRFSYDRAKTTTVESTARRHGAVKKLSNLGESPGARDATEPTPISEVAKMHNRMLNMLSRFDKAIQSLLWSICGTIHLENDAS